MKLKLILAIPVIAMLGASPAGAAPQGTIQAESAFDVSATVDKLEAFVKDKGFTVFARVDHYAGGKRVGLAIRPTQLLIFGNPKGGTVLMQCSQWVGLDLPLKILVWENEVGKTMMGYNDPAWLAKRHQLDDCGAKVIRKIGGFMQKLTGSVAR